MSSGQQQPPPQRRVTNVGSMLLTPQENESLFTFLGKKCVVSAPVPRHPRCYLAGPGWRAGKWEWEWGRRREGPTATRPTPARPRPPICDLAALPG
ncbi:Neural Wiskott-Aldrich syndrome protein [Galemys pyrenaicus]|uniref:Neural Wiskott-Aldrich syndrome protein n=1 Tax=Galemys pyrenaicus TaxID=202257 RepID=A0A8J6AX20_GALPY|nr:Neural Wiskott-Aldrich syndrome protein [Galemys pyrenaicus]